jgi:hypothetical protein
VAGRTEATINTFTSLVALDNGHWKLDSKCALTTSCSLAFAMDEVTVLAPNWLIWRLTSDPTRALRRARNRRYVWFRRLMKTVA